MYASFDSPSFSLLRSSPLRSIFFSLFVVFLHSFHLIRKSCWTLTHFYKIRSLKHGLDNLSLRGDGEGFTCEQLITDSMLTIEHDLYKSTES